MKVIIWICCIFVASAIKVGIEMFGGIQLGGIPTVLLYGVALVSAKKLCSIWDKHKNTKPDGSDTSTMGKMCSSNTEISESSIEETTNRDIKEPVQAQDPVEVSQNHRSENAITEQSDVQIQECEPKLDFIYGASISLGSEEQTSDIPLSTTSPSLQTQNTESETLSFTDKNEKVKPKRYCKRCGGAVDNQTRRCEKCGRQYFKAKTILPIIILAIAVFAFVGLNAIQYFHNKELMDTKNSEISNLRTTISTLNRSISDKDQAIEKSNDEITDLEKQISNKTTLVSLFQEKAGYFDDLCVALKRGKLGYASDTFWASESIIVVRKNQKNEKFTLTTNWKGAGDVSISYSPYSSPSARISFDDETWITSTTITIIPQKKGVTTVKFSNSLNSETFNVVIVVTD